MSFFSKELEAFINQVTWTYAKTLQNFSKLSTAQGNQKQWPCRVFFFHRISLKESKQDANNTL